MAWPLAPAGCQLIGVLLYTPFWVFPHQTYRGFFYANAAIGFLLEGLLIGGYLVEARFYRAPTASLAVQG